MIKKKIWVPLDEDFFPRGSANDLRKVADKMDALHPEAELDFVHNEGGGGYFDLGYFRDETDEEYALRLEEIKRKEEAAAAYLKEKIQKDADVKEFSRLKRKLGL